MTEPKTCPRCGLTQPIENYPRDKSRKSGYFPYCKTCNKKNSRKWVEEHHEHALEYLRDYRQRHLEKARAYGRAHAPKYRAIKPEVSRNVTRIRRARKRANTTIPPTPQDIQRRIAECGGACVYCGGAYSHVDHVIAIYRGGSDNLHNLVPACKECNLTKGSTNWLRWFRSRPFYTSEREAWIVSLISSASHT